MKLCLQPGRTAATLLSGPLGVCCRLSLPTVAFVVFFWLMVFDLALLPGIHVLCSGGFAFLTDGDFVGAGEKPNISP